MKNVKLAINNAKLKAITNNQETRYKQYSITNHQ